MAGNNNPLVNGSMAANTTTNTTAKTTTTGTPNPNITWNQTATNAATNPNNPYFLPTHTNTSELGQTSQPDVAAIVNSTMQSLLGRFATNEEIQRYGSELIAAERANQGSYSGETTYAISGKRNEVTGQQVRTGVDPQSFIANLINGTGEARSYKAATGYFDAMKQSNDKCRSAFSG